jgi:hypothetical protein
MLYRFVCGELMDGGGEDETFEEEHVEEKEVSGIIDELPVGEAEEVRSILLKYTDMRYLTRPRFDKGRIMQMYIPKRSLIRPLQNF